MYYYCTYTYHNSPHHNNRTDHNILCHVINNNYSIGLQCTIEREIMEEGEEVKSNGMALLEWSALQESDKG